MVSATAGVRTSLLRDAHGRVARDLRVSLTDRCNLRCSYCMPAEGVEWLPRKTMLSDDEVIRLISIGVRDLGINKVRFTGGEPLLRPGLVAIVRAAASLRQESPGLELSLTTNGVGLDLKAHALAEAGLDRVNISLDSLDRARYASLARRDRLADVLSGIAAADAAGLRPVKINAVVLRGVNEDDVVPLAEFCLRWGYQLRFIEQMPLGPRQEWRPDRFVTQSEILALLGERLGLTPHQGGRGSAPADLWDASAPGLPPGRIGVIASVSAPFCGACDRTRITSDGQLRNCLFASTETDLRGPLRGGASDAEIAELWRAGQYPKPAGHGIDTVGFVPPERTMSSIGG
ncbi:MAG: GTP 3',8-cyclase MoaA [Propionibacteriaceae bacterium]|nr:GTP 3',8-cyclase MoaA [Propionibacteriaceae bacterium]